jgi:hypothetical protein
MPKLRYPRTFKKPESRPFIARPIRICPVDNYGSIAHTTWQALQAFAYFMASDGEYYV